HGKSLRLETQIEGPSGASWPSLFWLPLVRFQVEWVSPHAEVRLEKDGFELKEWIAPKERGFFDCVLRKVSVEDVLGLSRIRMEFRSNTKVEVWPHIGRLKRLPVLMSLGSGEEFPHPMGIANGDRLDLRRYSPGDPARFIHWKALARTRRVMVRVPERSLSPSKRTLAYLVSGPNDEATASAARAAIENRLLGDEWVFAADGTPQATSSTEEALMAILRSAHAKSDGASRLISFLEEGERMGPASIVLFVPPQGGPWLERVTLALKTRSHRSRVVIGVDGLRPAPPRPPRRRVFFLPKQNPVIPIEHLEKVLSTLQALRVETAIVDRLSGQPLSPLHWRKPIASSPSLPHQVADFKKEVA
ncbi:MAG: DUF58 domain-containing protein, partial [Sandaracinaceae bacterium]|nr:DUF58 domain-containing protein [Sandaracinaceae bacterium]